MEIIYALSAFFFIIAMAESIAYAFLSFINKTTFFAARCALGLFFISFTLTILGLCGLFYPNMIFALSIIIFLILSIPRINNLSVKISEKIKMPLPAAKLPWVERITIMVLTAFVITIFLNCLSPATARDSLNYHLFLPKVWLEKHTVFTIKENIYSFFPHQWNMIYAYSLAIGNDITANLLHFFTLILSLNLIYKISLLLFGDDHRPAALSACLIFIAIPSVAITSAQAYVDIASVFYLLLAFYFALANIDKKYIFYFYLSALFLGSAAAIKYQAMPWLLLLPLFISAQKDPPNTKKVLIYTAISFIPLLPFLIRNCFACGNPFFPLFNSLFQSPLLNAEKNHIYTSLAQSFGFGSTIKDLLLSPVRIFFSAQFDSPKYFDGVIGLTLLIPLAIISFMQLDKNKPKITTNSINYAPLSLILLIYYLLWFITSQQIRFLFFPLAVIAILSSKTLIYSGRTSRWLICIAALIYISYPVKMLQQTKPLRFIAGIETRKEFLKRTDPVYPIMNKANLLCDPKKKVMLFLVGNGAYYLDRPVFQESLIEGYTMAKQIARGEKYFYEFLLQNNIGYIVTNEAIVAGDLPRHIGQDLYLRYTYFMRHNTKLIAKHDVYALYAIINR